MNSRLISSETVGNDGAVAQSHVRVLIVARWFKADCYRRCLAAHRLHMAASESHLSPTKAVLLLTRAGSLDL